MSRSARLFLPTLPLLLSFACAAAPARPSPVPSSTARPTTAPTAPSRTTPPPPAGLTDLDPSILVRLHYDTPDNFTHAVLPGYEANRGLLRPAAAAALLLADRELRTGGYRIVVLDAYRPVRATLAMVAWAHRVHRDDLVGPYIASHSEHNLGTAVDVTLARAATGAEIDMGAPFDTFSSAAHYPNATGTDLQNRTRLRHAMIAAGFRPYDEEWWHFSITVAGATPLDEPIR